MVIDGATVKAQGHGDLVLSPQGLGRLLLRAVGVSEHHAVAESLGDTAIEWEPASR